MKTVNKNIKIALLYGGLSSEREVSLRSGKSVYDTLIENGYSNVALIDVDRNIAAKLAEIKPEIALIVLHGTFGEDGKIQGLLEMMGIPYTGSGVQASAIAFDKAVTKALLINKGIPTAKYKLLNDANDTVDFMPVVLKPAREGSTVGITIVKDKKEYKTAVDVAFKYDSKVIAEQFISGKELTVAVLNGKAMHPIWIRPLSGFYDYEAKYTKGKTEYLFDLELKDSEIELIKKTAVDTYNAIGCEGVSRIDIIFDGKTPYVLEVNTLPGMTETSLLPKACHREGISFIALIEIMINDGLNRKKG